MEYTRETNGNFSQRFQAPSGIASIIYRTEHFNIRMSYVASLSKDSRFPFVISFTVCTTISVSFSFQSWFFVWHLRIWLIETDQRPAFKHAMVHPLCDKIFGLVLEAGPGKTSTWFLPRYYGGKKQQMRQFKYFADGLCLNLCKKTLTECSITIVDCGHLSLTCT